MKATPTDQKKLLSLQEIDTRLVRIARTEQTLPERETLAKLNVTLDEIMRRYGDARKMLDSAGEELARVESDVAVVEARAERDASRLEGTSSVKDVQALEAELQALSRRRSDLEDQQLAVMERIDVLESDYAAVDTERESVADNISENRTLLENKRAECEQQRNDALDERRALVDELPVDLVALYDKQRERYGIGAALLRGGVSLGSNVRLTQSELDDVRRAAVDDVVLCPDSNAILVRTEESGL